MTNPWKNIIQRRNRPQLVITVLFQFFQQFTGVNAIFFYAPPLFETLGFKQDASLYSAIITGGVNVLATVVGVLSVDRLGRRKLLLESGFQMFLAMVRFKKSVQFNNIHICEQLALGLFVCMHP